MTTKKKPILNELFESRNNHIELAPEIDKNEFIKTVTSRRSVRVYNKEKVKEEDENVKEEKEEMKDEEEKEEKVAEEETKEDKVTIDFEAPEWLINAALELNNQDAALTRDWLSEHAKMYILGKDLGDEEEKTVLNDEDFDDAAVCIREHYSL